MDTITRIIITDSKGHLKWIMEMGEVQRVMNQKEEEYKDTRFEEL